MSISCQKSIAINVITNIGCALCNQAFVAAVNAHFGTAWNGLLNGSYGSGAGLMFDCPQFKVVAGAGGVNTITFLDKVAAPSACNPTSTTAASSNPFITWTWSNWHAGCPIFDDGIPQTVTLMPCVLKIVEIDAINAAMTTLGFGFVWTDALLNPTLPFRYTGGHDNFGNSNINHLDLLDPPFDPTFDTLTINQGGPLFGTYLHTVAGLQPVGTYAFSASGGFWTVPPGPANLTVVIA